MVSLWGMLRSYLVKKGVGGVKTLRTQRWLREYVLCKLCDPVFQFSPTPLVEVIPSQAGAIAFVFERLLKLRAPIPEAVR
jgi:hypothetical protein